MIRFVKNTVQFGYSVFFENLATATAAAQKVVVTDQLDPGKVDMTAFSLGPITFGTVTMIPTPGLSEFTKDVDLRPAQNLIARTVAKLDKTTGLLTVTFSSLDPGTLQETQDPMLGLLPPNTAPPAGEGSVTFSVKPKSEIASGTVLCNQAVVVFDTNPALDTPTWCNTIDTVAPASKVAALPASESNQSFTVMWAGSDAGSGIATYTVYSSDNGGAFSPWQLNTANTSGLFTGQPGHTYGFYSIATDNAGNTEAAKSSAETATSVGSGNAAPVVTTQPANNMVIDGATVMFTAGATGSPVPTVQWQVSTNHGGPFTNVAGATSTSLTFTAILAQNGNQYRAVFTNTGGTTNTTAAVLTVNANQTTTIAGNITAKAGAQNARVWTLSLLNNGPGTANGAKISSFTLIQTAGAACTPVVSTALPAALGDLGPGQTGTVIVPLDFTGCATAARFTAKFTYSANNGAVSGSVVRTNQFQ